MTEIDIERRRWSNQFALAKLAFDQEIWTTKDLKEEHKRQVNQIRKTTKTMQPELKLLCD
jgi:hypothetical protein